MFMERIVRIKLLWFLLGCLPMILQAQSQQVTGKVTDEKGEALIGATILVKGTSKGTTADAEGSFTIEATSTSTLVVSYVGFITQQVEVGSQTKIDIKLLVSQGGLDEVVVIGYGERRVKDLTGSIGVVSSKDLTKGFNITPELAMQGRMAGVFVSTPGGSPTARPQVLIRGVSTFGNAEPLYVIDGVPITEFGTGTDGASGSAVADIRGTINIMSLINPNDIESISVLKDASAAAIYGVRAANGVVLITTKRGKAGKPKVEFDMKTGVQNVLGTYKTLTTTEFFEFYREAYAANKDAANLYDNLRPFENATQTYNWQEEVQNKNAATRDYNVRVSGGSGTTTYYMSGGYSKQFAPVKGNDLERFSMATSIQSKISKVFEAGLTYRFTYGKANDNAFSTGIPMNFNLLATNSPFQPIYDENGVNGFAAASQATFKPNPNYDPDKLSSGPPQEIDKATILWGPNTRSNLLALHGAQPVRYDLLRNIGSAYLQFEPLNGLKFKGSLSADYYYNWRRSFQDVNSYIFTQTPGNPFAIGDGTSKGQFTERHSRNFNLVKEFSISYQKTINNHNLNVLLNAMDQKYVYDFISGSTDQMNLAGETFRVIQSSPNRYNNSSSFRDPNALQGYMGRISYNFNNRYYLDATVRRDGSSRFAPENRWGIFPSFAAAWRVSSEPFFRELKFINDLKIRAGYGVLGNQETSDYAFLSSVTTAPSYAWGSGAGNAVGNSTFGAALPDFPNRKLTWEKAITSNIGFDALLFNNHLSATVEYYNRLTDGILQSTALPASIGNQNQPITNIASVRNSGIELNLNWTQTLGTFNFSIGGNLTTVKNEVVSLFQNQPFGGEFGRIEVGKPLFYYWGYKLGGVFQTEGEVETYRAGIKDNTNGGYQQLPGDMYFVDVNGAPKEAGKLSDPNPDGIIDNNDRTFIGSQIPGYYYGINMGLDWKGFDVSLFFQGVGDVQKFNLARASGESMSAQNAPNQWATVKDRWTTSNPSTTMPRGIINDPAGNGRFSDRWIESAAFFRLRNINVGYTLPHSIWEKVGVGESMRIYLSGNNLLTLTKWTGIDPEESDRSGSVIPPVRIFTFGINATF
jgi:TonB-dependent starch-binding outer membrane protein SusC